MKTTYAQRHHRIAVQLTESLNCLEKKLSHNEPLSDKDFTEAKYVYSRAQSYGMTQIIHRLEQLMFMPNPRSDAGKIITSGSTAMQNAARLTLMSLFKE